MRKLQISVSRRIDRAQVVKIVKICLLGLIAAAPQSVLAARPAPDSALSDKAPSPTILKGKEIKPVRTPGGTITTSEPARIKIVQIRNVPDDALHIEQWQGVTVKRTAPAPPGGISTAGATIYVSKSWIDTAPASDLNNRCAGAARGPDFVDLSVPRRHGFTLASFSIEQLPPPAGYGSNNAGPRRRGDILFTADGQPTGTASQAARIRTTASSRHYQANHVPTNMPTPCFTGYRVNISLMGPADIHPFTGQKIVQNPVN